MASKVFTGWRTIEPGECAECGFDDEWECDGTGTIYCSCQTCPECLEFDWHLPNCQILAGVA